MASLRFGVGLLLFAAAMVTANAQMFMPAGVRYGVVGAPMVRTYVSPDKAYELTLEETPDESEDLVDDATFAFTTVRPGNIN